MWWLEFTALKGKRSKPVSLGPFTEGVCSATELQGPLGTSHVTEKHIIHASGSRGYCWMSVLRSKYGIKTESQKNQWKLVHNSKMPFPPSTEQDKKVGGSSTLGKDSRGDSLGWLSCKSQTPDACSNGGISDWCWGNQNNLKMDPRGCEPAGWDWWAASGKKWHFYPTQSNRK